MTRPRRRDPLLEPLLRGHAELVHRVEALERELRALHQRLDAVEGRRPRAAADERHVPAGEAAGLLGVDTRTVRRLIAEGRLLGRGLRFPGSSRRHWVVNAVSLARLIAPDGGPPAAPAAPLAGEIRTTGAG